MTRTFVRHLRDASFTPGRSPSYAYRDLGIGEATGGAYQARVIRSMDGMREDHWHTHPEPYAISYYLKGWLEVDFEEYGRCRIETGDIIQTCNAPPHREASCGGGLEILYIQSAASLRPGANRSAERW